MSDFNVKLIYELKIGGLFMSPSLFQSKKKIKKAQLEDYGR